MWIESNPAVAVKEVEEPQNLLSQGATEQSAFETHIETSTPRRGIRVGSPYVARFDHASILGGLTQMIGEGRSDGSEAAENGPIRIRHSAPLSMSKAGKLAALLGVTGKSSAQRLSALSDLGGTEGVHILQYFQKNPYKPAVNNRLSPDLELPHVAPRPKQQPKPAATNLAVERMSACLPKPSVTMPSFLGVNPERRMVAYLDPKCTVDLTGIEVPPIEDEVYDFQSAPIFQAEPMAPLPSAPTESPDEDWLVCRLEQVSHDADDNFDSLNRAASPVTLRLALEEANSIYQEVLNIITEGYGELSPEIQKAITDEDVITNFDRALMAKAQAVIDSLVDVLAHDENSIFACLPPLKKEMRIGGSLLKTRSAQDVKAMRYVVDARLRGNLRRQSEVLPAEPVARPISAEVKASGALSYESIKTEKKKTQALVVKASSSITAKVSTAWTTRRTLILKPSCYAPENSDAICFDSIQVEILNNRSWIQRMASDFMECFPHVFNFLRVAAALFSPLKGSNRPHNDCNPTDRLRRLAMA